MQDFCKIVFFDEIRNFNLLVLVGFIFNVQIAESYFSNVLIGKYDRASLSGTRMNLSVYLCRVIREAM